MHDYQNSFYQADLDEFDDKDMIPAIYPRNPYDDEDADNIFGLGNKQKKAQRKLAKAEKKLAKGKTKAAERKISKANKLLSKVQAGVDKNQSAVDAAQQQIANINAATNQTPTEQMQTDAGQIGAQAGAVTPYANTGGSGGGDISGDGGYTPETNLANPTAENTTPSDEPTGDLANVKTMEGVTVTATKGNKTIMLIVIGALVLLAIWYFSKKGKLKTKL